MKNSFVIIAITVAFFVGAISANPIVEAAGGWQKAIAIIQEQITTLESQVNEAEEIYFITKHRLAPAGEQIRIFENCGDDIFLSASAKVMVTTLTSDEEVSSNILKIRFGNSPGSVIVIIDNPQSEDYKIEASFGCIIRP